MPVPRRKAAADSRISADFTRLWVSLAGPPAGSLLAVGIAHILRGPGGQAHETTAAQGRLHR
ncbi:hypothetical protein [Arthrobacter bambusae]|uniref:hypothetical protein n=1 Tax=Arthrobacter bambusae TaxID=1338426 RepID=UPI002788BE4F|nr:hypothetical protein [Arthrobacter bambusae]MDQ0028575.1 hypothetical protein [Arthrobacter bambusae]MDQ0096631.1 hypothetical protein [Arthrobacter bambusae]